MHDPKKRTITQQTTKKHSHKLIKFDSPHRFSEQHHNPKTYKLLMHKFLSQVAAFSKKHKDCLGQIDDYYKIVLTREEKILQEEKLEVIFEKNIEKLKKEMIYRNSDIQKTRNQYLQQCEKIFPPFPIENHSVEDLELQQSKKLLITDSPFDNQPKPDKKTIFENQRSKSNKMHRIINQIGRVKETKGKNVTTQSTNMEDPEFNQPQSYECLILKRQSKKRNEFLGKQVLIQRNSSKKGSTINYNSTTINKFFNRNYTHAKQILKKSMDEIQRQKIQNKLIMINSNHSINCVQPQGYKPKIKCWKPCFQNQNRYLL